MSPPERVGRGYAGILMAGLGGGFLGDAGSVIVVGAELMLILAGLYLALTGMLGRCPIYRKLDHVPSSLKDWGP